MPFLPIHREERREARLIRRLARQPKAPIHNQITLVMTGRQPALEEMFMERARLHKEDSKK